MISNGDTVQVIKNPAVNADMNCNGIPFGIPAAFITYLH
jgi:hypothetical protein